MRREKSEFHSEIEVLELDRSEKGEQLFRSGYNCAQSVLGAFCDDLGLDFDTAMKISEGFGGGFARMRLTCGAVSAIAMVVGMMFSRGAGEGNTRAEVYNKTKELADRFKEMNGSVICGELLGIENKSKYDPVPEKRTEEYYKKRPCVEYVKYSIKLIENEFFEKNIQNEE